MDGPLALGRDRTRSLSIGHGWSLRTRRRRAVWGPLAAVGLVVGTLVGAIPATLAGAGSAVSVVEFTQCSNGAPGTTPSAQCNGGFINGTLNSNNSQYREEDVVP